jgi:hypothetical protein
VFVSRLYKYLPEQYVEAFVREGAILFRSLSYFRDYEADQVRGDEFEGTRLYRPQGGLEITLTATQRKIALSHSFESSVNEDDIFVFCLSRAFSVDLAAEFQASACVEILNPGRFIAGIRAALLRRPSIKNKMLMYGEVKYYTQDEPPIVDWALPERIAMSKRSIYIPQQEYRITFAINGAFSVENTRVRLAAPGEQRALRAQSHPERLFKLGSLAKLCKVHYFN